jgi:preprotein translocase subunit YajC
MKLTALFTTLLFTANAFAQDAAQKPAQGNAIMSFLPFILMFVIMYLFFIMPKQKEAKKLDAMRKALKKGDKVLTSAGIIGSVANIEDTLVTIKTGNDTKLDFERSAILRVLEVKAEEKTDK